MRTLKASLPMRKMDEAGGDLWAATYYRMLGDYSEAEITFMAARAANSCEWFPTIAECHKIIEQWSRDDVFVRLGQAATRTWREHERALREERDMWMDKLRRGEIVDVEAIPQWIVRYARSQGFLLERSIEQVQHIYRHSALYAALFGITPQEPQESVKKA